MGSEATYQVPLTETGCALALEGCSGSRRLLETPAGALWELTRRAACVLLARLERGIETAPAGASISSVLDLCEDSRALERHVPELSLELGVLLLASPELCPGCGSGAWAIEEGDSVRCCCCEHGAGL